MHNTNGRKESEQDSSNITINSFRFELKLDTKVILRVLAIIATAIGVGLVI